MIVRAGGLTLQAPDEMPELAREAVQALQALTVEALTVSPDTDMSDAWPHIAAVEVAAFGRRRTARLRRCGEPARLAASRQLLVGWGQAITQWGAGSCH